MNMWVYIKYCMKNKPWDYPPQPRYVTHNIKIATKSSYQKPGGSQKLNIRHSILYNHRQEKTIISSSI